ncbi:MAG: T9SS type A sorting domain-containing protein [bacterium]|nr:T9SS type A sorting domain-containing protein [bacterium]
MFAVVLLALLISVPVRAELRDPNNSADYIILTNQEVLSNNAWIDSLLDYRAAQGRVAMAVTVEEIWAEFTPSGSDTAIREFLHYAYDNWQAPQLKDVFIVGHWDVVPSGMWIGVYDSMSFASDYWYVLRSGADSGNPLFRVGRLAWSPRYSEPLSDFSLKIREYEASPIGEWQNRCHFVADSGESVAWNELIESYAEGIVAGVPSTSEIERDYLSRVTGDPWYGDRNEIIENLNAGSLLSCYSGISSGYEILPEDPITALDIEQLHNLESLTMMMGTVSHALGIDTLNGTPLFHAAMNSSSGGAIAAFGMSGIGWFAASRVYSQRLVSELYNISQSSIGDAWFTTCNYYADSALHGGLPRTAASDQLFGTFLLGDPATIIPGRTTSADPITAPVIPASIQIVGNYPNPFNPSTTINFILNRAGNARLTVYDITGRAVTTLAEQSFTAGQHSIVWNAAGLASGIYLVRLESSGQFDTHKITLLK